MRSRLSKIRLYKKKGEAPRLVQEAQVVEKYGLAGDRHCMKEERQISMTSGDLITWMAQQPMTGLCFRKFSANLILDGMEEVFHDGDLVGIGENAVLRVTDIHKTCYQDGCGFFESGRKCLLQGGIWFAKGVQSGLIHTGDFVYRIEGEQKNEIITSVNTKRSKS